VILDTDLASLYGVETKQLKRAVKRNSGRFPIDFMFELTSEELAKWRSQFGTSNRGKMGLRISPFAFTEYGVLMLASVLNSERAIQVNIQIVRIFAKMREMLVNNKQIIEKLEKLEQMYSDHNEQILLIFDYLRQLEKS
jgi:phage regulator Rha-like protein